ncbi:MAG: hypothetical protein KJO98_04285 [Rhodothermia bacterium]|nr:hypothetical protein [Rhodothermia bacterium]
MKNLTIPLTLTLAIAISAALTGCDSNSEKGGDLSAETSEAVAKTFSDAFSIVSLALVEIQSGKSQSVAGATSPQGACPEGGSFDVSGSSSASQSSFSVDVSIDFNDCNGLNGSLAIDGSGAFSETAVSLDIFFDGAISGDQCSLSFDRFRETLDSDFQTGNTILTLDGNYRGACSQQEFTCSFNDVVVDTSSEDDVALVQRYCSLR